MDSLIDRFDFGRLRRAISPGWRAALMLAASLGAGTLHAADVGSVRGIVHDQQHRPISMAEVRLRSATSDWAQTRVTDAQGEFSFMTVPLGDYVLSFSAGEFMPAAQAVTVTSGSSPIGSVRWPARRR